MKFVSVEKRSRSPSFFVNVSLAMVTSSTVTSSKLHLKKFREMLIYITNITLKIQKTNAV